MVVQTLGERGASWQFENPAVVNDASADIASSQRNNPAPPAIAHEMVRRPRSAGATSVGEIGKFLPQLIAVPIFCIREACPDGVNRVFGVWSKISEQPRDQSGAAARIDDPPRPNRTVFVCDRHGHGLAVDTVQLQRSHFRRTQ